MFAKYCVGLHPRAGVVCEVAAWPVVVLVGLTLRQAVERVVGRVRLQEKGAEALAGDEATDGVVLWMSQCFRNCLLRLF